MATQFRLNTPVTTTENAVDVQNDLPIGTHTFQLVVVDDQGNRSDPTTAKVIVRRIVVGPPIPPITPVTPGPIGPIGPITGGGTIIR